MTYAVFDQYKVTDVEALAKLIAESCFATVVTQQDGLPFANHFPLFQERGDEGLGCLVGHMHRHNTQLKHLAAGQQVLAIFQGPWAYVPAHADCDENAVPTMSFIVAHLYGPATLIDDRKELLRIVAHTVRRMGRNDQPQWNFDIPRELLDALLGQIVGFRIAVERFETQFKLQQDRSVERRRSIQSYFAEQEDPTKRRIADWMEMTFNKASC